MINGNALIAFFDDFLASFVCMWMAFLCATVTPLRWKIQFLRKIQTVMLSILKFHHFSYLFIIIRMIQRYWRTLSIFINIWNCLFVCIFNKLSHSYLLSKVKRFFSSSSFRLNSFRQTILKPYNDLGYRFIYVSFERKLDTAERRDEQKKDQQECLQRLKWLSKSNVHFKRITQQQ